MHAGPRAHILVVDDDLAIRVLFSRILAADCEVTAVSSAAEARVLIETRDFDLLVTDARMPDSSGLELLDSVRRLKPQLPCLLTTGAADEYREEMEARGVVVLSKPVQSKTLIAAVRAALQ